MEWKFIRYYLYLYLGEAKEINKKKIKTVSTSENNLLESPENNKDNLFLVYELSKYYGKLMAVQEISFRVKQRECFGLLGVNGAGKSTTFRMLTGEEIPNSGIMYLGKSEININRKDVIYYYSFFFFYIFFCTLFLLYFYEFFI